MSSILPALHAERLAHHLCTCVHLEESYMQHCHPGLHIVGCLLASGLTNAGAASWTLCTTLVTSLSNVAYVALSRRLSELTVHL